MNMYLEYASGMGGSKEALAWVKTTLKAYLEKNPQTTQVEIEHLLDYACSSDGPRKMVRMSYAQLKEKAEKWNKTQQKKGAHIKEEKKDTKTILKFKDGSRIAMLVGKPAFEREGFLMGHCVASFFGKTDRNIYSYRDEDNMPHATFDITKSDEITQVKGKGNGSIHPKYINPILAFFKKLKVEIRDSEMKNLGYYALDDELEKLITLVMGECKKVKINKTEYVFAS